MLDSPKGSIYKAAVYVIDFIRVSKIVPSIDKLQFFCKHLGKYRVERIRYAQKGSERVYVNAHALRNTVLTSMGAFSTPYQPPIENILAIAVEPEDDRIPLSVQRLFNIFQCMPVITVKEISIMLDVGPRQAWKYLKAAKFALPLLEKELRRDL